MNEAAKSLLEAYKNFVEDNPQPSAEMFGVMAFMLATQTLNLLQENGVITKKDTVMIFDEAAKGLARPNDPDMAAAYNLFIHMRDFRDRS